MKIAQLAIGFLLVLVAMGCGGPEYAEVEGVVTLKGEPLKDLEVIFMPDPYAGNKGPSSRGFTDENGKYQIKSVRGRDGAVVGMHRVCIRDFNQSGKVRVPPDYGTSRKTPLKNIEVTKGLQTHNFEIDSE